MPAGEIIFDTSCLLHLTAVGHENLLEERYGGRCYIPDEVETEIKRGEVDHRFKCARLLQASWWKPLSITDPDDQALFFDLLRRWGKPDRNRGEAAAIVLAKRRRCTAVLDDSQGRRAAEILGIPKIGTVGILTLIAVDGRLDEESCWAIHEAMVQNGFRSPLRTEQEFRYLVAKSRTP